MDKTKINRGLSIEATSYEHLKGAFDTEAFLEDLGIDIGFQQREHQWMCHCPFPENHKNGDTNPSFGFNEEKLAFNCLAGETKVTTWEGEVEIATLAGLHVQLLDGNGRWVWADVSEFGQQMLCKVSLRRNKQRKIVYATPEHRWILRVDGKRTRREAATEELLPGHRLAYALPQGRPFAVEQAHRGYWIPRGFVFGDGTRQGNFSVAYFCGSKDEAMMPYFDPFDGPRYSYPYRKQISRLPHEFKDLPLLNIDLGSAYCWLQGYFAADGCVDERGQIILTSSNRSNLEYCRTIATAMGVATYGITEQLRKGYGTEPTLLYFLRFVGSTLTEDFFLIPQHRQRFRPDKADRIGWTVESVEPTDREETVYCAIVPTTHSFVLDDNLVTGNCFVCGGGNILSLIRRLRPEIASDEDALRYAEQFADLNREVNLVAKIQSILHPDDEEEELPDLPSDNLFQYRKIHPYLYERGISKSVITEMQVGFDEEHLGITIPHFFMGKLVGMQRRHLAELSDGTFYCPRCSETDKRVPKYKNTSRFPKVNTLYGYDHMKQYLAEQGGGVIVVESPFSVLKLKSLGFHKVVGTFGQFSREQSMLLIAVPVVYYWPDNDEAGLENAARAIEFLGRLTNVKIVPVVEGKKGDPGDLEDADCVLEYLKHSWPASLFPMYTQAGKLPDLAAMANTNTRGN